MNWYDDGGDDSTIGMNIMVWRSVYVTVEAKVMVTANNEEDILFVKNVKIIATQLSVMII